MPSLPAQAKKATDARTPGVTSVGAGAGTDGAAAPDEDAGDEEEDADRPSNSADLMAGLHQVGLWRTCVLLGRVDAHENKPDSASHYLRMSRVARAEDKFSFACSLAHSLHAALLLPCPSDISRSRACHQRPDDPAYPLTLAVKHFVFALIWSVGAACDDASRPKFMEFLRPHLEPPAPAVLSAFTRAPSLAGPHGTRASKGVLVAKKAHACLWLHRRLLGASTGGQGEESGPHTRRHITSAVPLACVRLPLPCLVLPAAGVGSDEDERYFRLAMEAVQFPPEGTCDEFCVSDRGGAAVWERWEVKVPRFAYNKVVRACPRSWEVVEARGAD